MLERITETITMKSYGMGQETYAGDSTGEDVPNDKAVNMSINAHIVSNTDMGSIPAGRHRPRKIAIITIIYRTM